jgi:predicted AlkP superfamily pyrophosphatase or phosphodiesterase
MKYINEGWFLLKPTSAYDESLVDDNPYEGKLDKSMAPVFPYNLKKIFEEKGADVLRTTPYGNDILADLAMRAIDKEQLGKDSITDFLAVSFSSTDYVGHTFGPRSMELQDTYLRLDLTLAKFMSYLDQVVGKENYVLFLTADHAGAENPNYLKDNKYNVKNVPSKKVDASLRKFSQDTFGADLILNYSNFNVYFNKPILKEKGLDLIKVKQSFKDFLMTQEHVNRVYTEEEILASTGDDYFLSFIAKGYDPKQNGDLFILDKVGFMEYIETGTTHGSPNSYDTHVPMLFYGWHVPKGNSYSKKQITQIAPTLSQLLKIPFTNGTDSEVLVELFDKK